MSWLSDYEKMEDARLVKHYIGQITQEILEIRTRADKMVAAKTKYPEYIVEIDEIIADIKAALLNLANRY